MRKRKQFFLLIWGITRLPCPLYPQMKNVSLVHSCLEIPILKCLRCRRSNQMNKHISLRIPTSYTGLLLMRGKTFQFVIRRANMVNWGLRSLWSFFKKGLTEAASERWHNLLHLCRLCQLACVNTDISCILICSHDTFRSFSSPSVLGGMMEIQHAALSLKTFSYL